MCAQSQGISSKIFINHKGKNSDSMVGKLSKHHLNQATEVNNKTGEHRVPPDVTHREEHITPGVPQAKLCPHSDHEKTSDTQQQKEGL